MELVANIDLVEEIEFAHSQGAGGIGLYRTEGQINGKGAYPDEEQQFREYKAVVDLVFPHPVVFRAFDVGGDKIDPDGSHEANTFLGWRGIRVLLDRPELYLGQPKPVSPIIEPLVSFVPAIVFFTRGNGASRITWYFENDQ